jgi:hypothetical protein
MASASTNGALSLEAFLAGRLWIRWQATNLLRCDVAASMMRILALIITTVGALLIGAPLGEASPQPPSFLIRASSTFQRVGNFWISDDPSYGAAQDALGAASSCHVVQGGQMESIATWRSLGVTMRLSTLGLLPGGRTLCTSPAAPIDSVRVSGRRWYTSKGLRVGDSVGRLRSLYPEAPYLARTWRPGWGPQYALVTRRATCLGVCGNQREVTVPVLSAAVRNGRVTAFLFSVGAEGE